MTVKQQKNQKLKYKLPNFLTNLRILLVPVVIGLLLSAKAGFSSNLTLYIITDKVSINILEIIAFSLFVFASFTDYLDGYLARKWKIESAYGKFMDPIADKLLVNSVFIIFTVWERIPIWVTLIIILRDIIINSWRMILAEKNIVLSAKNFGKLKTVFQMIGISVLFIVYQDLSESNSLHHLSLIPIYIATFFSIISAVEYIGKSWKVVLK